MKNPVYIFLLSTLMLLPAMSCQKQVEEQKRDMLLQIMTDGSWHVETYQLGSTTITDQFSGYNFQFFENGTVTGAKDSISQQGTWIGDVQNLSVTSDFPSDSDPLVRLNGTWKITDSEADYVVAEMTTNDGKAILHLRKNS